MYVGRKLLFHRGEVDDSLGTYVTDYAIAVVCFVIAGYLMYIVKRHKARDDRRLVLSWECYSSNVSYWLPWHWPRNNMTSVAMTTYVTIVFLMSYGLMTFLGGLTHQFLQQVEPYNDWRDGWIWLISWRVAAGFVFISMSSMLTLLEQINMQEGVVRLSHNTRVIYYVTMLFVTIAAILVNYIRLADNHPYDIEKTYISFVGCTIFYGVGMFVIFVRSCCQSSKKDEVITKMSKNSREESVTLRANFSSGTNHCDVRWDLLYHCAFPWVIVAGGIFSYVLTPICSHDNAQKMYDCPLPDCFNHNAIMHTIHIVALIFLGLAETYAVKRRNKLCDVTNAMNNNV